MVTPPASCVSVVYAFTMNSSVTGVPKLSKSRAATSSPRSALVQTTTKLPESSPATCGEPAGMNGSLTGNRSPRGVPSTSNRRAKTLAPSCQTATNRPEASFATVASDWLVSPLATSTPVSPGGGPKGNSPVSGAPDSS